MKIRIIEVLSLLSFTFSPLVFKAKGQADGNYSVTESWSVTLYRGAQDVTTTYTGKETGTLVITNGGYSQVNHTGAASLGRLDTTRTVSYDGSNYGISGAYPLSAVAGGPGGFYAVIQLSFFVILVPLGSQADIPNPYPFDSSVFSTSGTSLTSLSGAGKMVDQNSAFGPVGPSYNINEVEDSSTASLAFVSPLPTGSLQVTITPSDAVSAGADWRVDGGLLQNSGAVVSDVWAGSHTVSFSTIGGWITPSNQIVSVSANSTTKTTGNYLQQAPVNYSGVVFATLYSFTGGIDGSDPEAELVQGSDGYFYGTTSGGANTNGTVFKISTNSALTTLYSFTGGNDGANPQAGLVQGSDGNFYGTTSDGSSDYGTVFKISTDGALTTLFSFDSADSADGATPAAAMLQGSDGNFYGTTVPGGMYFAGNVFRISSSGALTSLYAFTGGNDGGHPLGGLVQGNDGYLYGTTQYGGATNFLPPFGPYGYGTVFKIATDGALTSLHSFTGANDGAFPLAGLVQGSDGYFYGTTQGGGTNGGRGTVFKIGTNGALTSLHSFTGANDGGTPEAGLVQGSDGYLYGTTYYGGTNNSGTVFKISTDGALTSLHSFTVANDGGNPAAGLLQGSDGYFYGTTSTGGVGGAGTIFRLAPLLPSLGSLQMTITPTAAITAGAQWQVDGGTWLGSGATVANLSVGNHTVSFSTISGWISPSNQIVSVTANSTTKATGTYAQQTPVTYTITVSATPSTGGNVTGGGTFVLGTSETVTAAPNSGYTFANWTENGTVVSSASSYTFTLSSNVNLVANFTSNPVTYAVTLTAAPSSGGTVSGGGTFVAGSMQTVTAAANPGYTFVNWTENGNVVSSSPDYTFTVETSLNLVANFSCNSSSFAYATNNGTITITGYSGCPGGVAIPGTINGLPVTDIGANAFAHNSNLSVVTIPNSVTNIGAEAFYYCTSLSSVAISDSVTAIGAFAFFGCFSLRSVAIPASVTSVGQEVFTFCPSLTTITVNPQNPIYSSVSGVLFDKSQSTLLSCPGGLSGSYTIPTGVTNIGNYAFQECSLAGIAIPTTVTLIGVGAFNQCFNLTSVTIPSSVSSIGSGAFFLCTSLTAIAVDAQNPFYSSVDGVLFDKSQATVVGYPGGLGGSYTIFGSVKQIGDSAFSGCTSLISVTIPNSATNISSYAFYYCTSLTNVFFLGNAPTADSTVFTSDNNATVYYLPGTTGWGPTFGGRPTALWTLPYPLILTSSPGPGVQNNRFTLNISWATNASIVVEASTNLAKAVWQALQTNALVGGYLYFTDPNWTNSSGRFYRVRKQ